MAKPITIMIVAGEASGDAHAAKLVRALRDQRPDATFFGATGPKMREAGVNPVVTSDDLSIVGLPEIAVSLPLFISSFRTLTKAAKEQGPSAVVLVDFPEFNLRLAGSLKKIGLKVIYYISPQLWAWRQGRVETIRKYVDLLLTILPFEKDWYRTHGFEKVEYVGNPLALEVHAQRDKQGFCRDHGLDPDRPIVALLPGSRRKEITRILPIMIQAMSEMTRDKPEIQFVIALATAADASIVGELLDAGRQPLPDRVFVVANETYDVLSASDAAAVTSGTATLEAGILNTPMAVVYRTSAINYVLFEPMIDVPHYGLINLIAGKTVAKELIQNDFTPRALSEELLRLLNPEVNASLRAELLTAADKLGQGGASKRAADAILKLVST